MKKLLLLIGLTCTAALTGSAQTSSAREQQRVQQTLVNLFEGFSAFDVNQIISYCTEDVKILENGVIWNVDSLRLRLNQGNTRDIKRINNLDFTQTRVQGQTAWTTYYNRADVTVNGKHRTWLWLESAVLVKKGKDWKVNLLHSTVIERPKNN